MSTSAKERAHHPEKAAEHAADGHLQDRRKVLNRRLRNWGLVTAGGLGLIGAAVVTAPFVPVIPFGLAVAGGAMEGIGTIGIGKNMWDRYKFRRQQRKVKH